MRNHLASTIGVLLLIGITGCSPADTELTVEATETLIAYVTKTRPISTPPNLESGTIAPSGPTATPFVHIVQQGETLLGIAIQYGVTLDNLLLVNPGVDPRILSVGQSVRIPGPEGEPLDLLLPTPTPMQLTIDPVYCYSITGDQLKCLTQLINNLSLPAEGIGLQLSLYDAKAELLDHAATYSLIRVLPAGSSTVVDATFQVDPDQVAFVDAELISAVQVSNLAEKSLEVDLTNLQVDRFSDNRLIHFTGVIELVEDPDVGRVNLTIQVAGYNLRKEPIGIKAYTVDLESSNFPYPFELSLFSLSEGIDDFNFLIEAISLNSLD